MRYGKVPLSYGKRAETTGDGAEASSSLDDVLRDVPSASRSLLHLLEPGQWPCLSR